MQLINLQVIKSGSLVREINFKSGINIITNNDPKGNHIGKSTALRAINFCLGSDGKSLWKDPDSKTENLQIERFVTGGDLFFILNIKIRGVSYCIKRTILKVEQKNRTILKITSWINEKEIDSNDQFKAELCPILGFSVQNPTYGSIKNRFIRIDKSTSNNTYRYLNSNTKDKDYILYYSYIFGFLGYEDLSKERALVLDKDEREKRMSILLNGASEQSYKDKLKSIDDEIEILNKREDDFDFMDSQNEAILRLSNHRKEIARISSDISNLEIKINYSNRTIVSYESKFSQLDLSLISEIYAEAKVIIPNLKRTLEQAIQFHDSIIQKKVSYLRKQMDFLLTDINKLRKRLNLFLIKEKDLVKAIANESHLGGFIVLEKELQEKREGRGRVSVIIDEVNKEAKAIRKIDGDINKYRDSNKLHMAQLKENIKTFNAGFVEYTRSLFGNFSLSLNVDTNSSTNELEFSIVNENKVAGDGAPRAAALAFDMALIEYTKKAKATLPEFTVQDYLESVDPDKLAKLAKIANKKEIQVVMAILHDKLQGLDADFVEKNTVLYLSQENKFFKIN